MKKNKLTIVVPLYHSNSDLNNIMRNFYKQKDQRFDLILILDKASENDLEIIAKAKETFDTRLKIILNSTHQHLYAVLTQAQKFVNTNYTYIFYSGNTLKSGFVTNFYNYLKSTKNPADYIEFIGIIEGVVNQELTKKNIKSNELIDLNIDTTPLALNSPFSFNMVIKSDILKQIYQNDNVKNMKGEYHMFFSYLALLLSKTYILLDSSWIECRNEDILKFNPKLLNRSWDFIYKYYKKHQIENQMEALKFAHFLCYFYYNIGYLGEAKYKYNKIAAKTLKNIRHLLNEEIVNQIDYWKNEMKDNAFFIKLQAKKLIDFVENSDIKDWKHIFSKFSW